MHRQLFLFPLWLIKQIRLGDHFQLEVPKITRRASGSGDLLNLPAVGHRRSRSANGASRVHDTLESTPPPPYSYVVNTPPPVPPRPDHPQATANELPVRSRHAWVSSTPLSVPQNPPRHNSVSSRNAYLRAPIRRDTAENVLETLRKFNTVFVVDDSRSMRGALWQEVDIRSIPCLRICVYQSCRPEMHSPR